MPVIKSNRSSAAIQGAIVLDMGDLRRQADLIIENAKAQAAQIIAEANKSTAREAERIAKETKAQAQEQGFAAGEARGLKQGHDQALTEAEAQLQTVRQSWQQALTSWEQQREQLFSDARQVIFQVVKIFSEKVVHRVIDVDSSVIADQVDEAFASVLRPTELRVRINPNDRPALDEALPDLLQTFPNVQQAHLVHDDQISPGGCVVEFGQGRIDATIETQLSRMTEMLIPANTPSLVADEESVAVAEVEMVDEVEAVAEAHVEVEKATELDGSSEDAGHESPSTDGLVDESDSEN